MFSQPNIHICAYKVCNQHLCALMGFEIALLQNVAR
jgi:hypothetical protein